MSLSIIPANPADSRTVLKSDFLNVAEFFCDTIQGENFVGYPAAFLRLKDCYFNCVWCDSRSVWRHGNPYTFSELFELMESVDLPRKFLKGQHLVLTGGSPLKQQGQLVKFLHSFRDRYNFTPFIEVENECAVLPEKEFIEFVSLWNNSPKLANSGISKEERIRVDVLMYMSSLKNSWFKFVVESDQDWQEIQVDFLDAGLIEKTQIVLMPMGGSRQELEANRMKVVNIAIRENVRYTSREHVVLWDKVVGV